MNLVFTAFFAFEFVVKFAAFGLREYVKDPWNNFDFVIVIGSFLDIIMAQVRMSKMVRTINYYEDEAEDEDEQDGEDDQLLWIRLEPEEPQFPCCDSSGRCGWWVFLLVLVGSRALVSIKYS